MATVRERQAEYVFSCYMCGDASVFLKQADMRKVAHEAAVDECKGAPDSLLAVESGYKKELESRADTMIQLLACTDEQLKESDRRKRELEALCESHTTASDETRHDDWGKLVVAKITDASHLVVLMDELYREYVDNACCFGFYNNRGSLCDAFKGGRLYGVDVAETDSMFKRDAQRDRIWMYSDDGQPHWHQLPAFCIINDAKSIEFLWVANRARRLGIGKALVAKFSV